MTLFDILKKKIYLSFLMKEKQNKKFIVTVFKKKLLIFLSVLVFGWASLSSADLDGGNIFMDTDGDGLFDKEELAIGTDPNNIDTDGDGYTDKVEIESGYDPLKPAPGDKIVPEDAGSVIEESIEEAGAEDKEGQEEDVNLTEQFFQQLEQQKAEEFSLLQEVSSNPSILTEEEVMNQLQELNISNLDIEEILSGSIDSVDIISEMEMIPEEELLILDEIKEEDEEERKKLEKKQIEAYIAQAGFVLITNSPIELDESKDLSTLAVSFVGDMSSYVDMGNKDKLSEYRKQGTVILEKLKELETPYVMKDLHITGLSLFNYLINEIDEDALIADDDPVETMLSLGKIQSLLGEFENLRIKTDVLLENYGINTIEITDRLIGE